MPETMKKTFYHIGMLAVAALAFAGCAKEVDTRNEVRTHTVTFIAQSEETKTAIVEGQSSATYKWTTGDEQYLNITENGVAAESVSLALSSGNTVATITATFPTPTTTPNEYVYEAVYAKELSNKGNPAIQTTQEPASDSFDPSADVMIAEAVTSTTAVSPLTFCFRRVVSVNKMTLKGLVAGEKVSSVEISADKSLGGYYLVSGDGFQYSGTKLTLNYSNAEVGSDGQFPVYFVCAPQSEVKIGVRVVTDQNVYERNDFTKTVDFKVGLVKRFGVQLGSYGTPVQTGTPYSLVSSQAGLISGATYLLVASDGTDLYALGEQKTNNRAGVAVTDNNGVITIDNTIAAYPLEIEAVTNGYTMKDVASKEYLYSSHTDKNYLRSTSDASDSKAVWTISFDSDGAHITNVGNTSRAVLRFNPNNGSPLFACYASNSTIGTKDLALYIDASALIPTLATPTIVAGAAGKTITVIWEDVANADSYLVTCTGQADKTVNPGVEQADFVVQADGTYTVTVTAVSNDHTAYLDSAPASETVTVGNPALGKPVISAFTQTATGFSATLSAAVANATSYDWNLYEGYVDDGNEVGDGSFDATSLTINVPFSDTGLTYFEPDETYLLVVTAKAAGYTSTASDPASFVATAVTYDFTTVAELNSMATATATNYTGQLTNAVVSFVPSANDAVIKDNTGSIIFHKTGHNLLQGQTFSGVLDVTLLVYQSSYSELTECSATFVGNGGVVDPATMTLATLVGNYSTYQNAYVKVEGLEVTAVSGKNVTVKEGNNSYNVFTNYGNASCVVGDIITAVGTVTRYSNNDQIKVWASTDFTVTTHATATNKTVAQVLENGPGSYNMSNLLVYAVNGKNAIVGDSTGKMFLFMDNQLAVGDNISIASAGAAEYNGILEITSGDITKNSSGNAVNHGTATNLNDANAASALYSTFSATGFHSATYISMTGLQSGRYVENSNAKLYLNVANATYDTKNVHVVGYVYSYSSSYANYNFHWITIEEDTTTPSLAVSASALNWTATEYGSNNAKTINVTLNAAAQAGSYTISGNSNDWYVNKNGNTITVYPLAANTSTTAAKSLTLTITHSGDANLSKQVVLTQAKATTGGFTPFSVWEDDFSTCTSSSTALTSLSGSKSGFTGNYSAISSTYAMTGAIRIGKASAAGSITTPVLSSITGSSVDLTVTFKAAGWNGKTAKLTLTVNKGSVTEGQTTIASESTMAGSTPSMTGTSYTFHISGADSTTKITFSTTNSIGIDDLVITQTTN